jgi:hypothetical protein
VNEKKAGPGLEMLGDKVVETGRLILVFGLLLKEGAAILKADGPAKPEEAKK